MAAFAGVASALVLIAHSSLNFNSVELLPLTSSCGQQVSLFLTSILIPFLK
jgi:hypothetical protein